MGGVAEVAIAGAELADVGDVAGAEAGDGADAGAGAGAAAGDAAEAGVASGAVCNTGGAGTEVAEDDGADAADAADAAAGALAGIAAAALAPEAAAAAAAAAAGPSLMVPVVFEIGTISSKRLSGAGIGSFSGRILR